MNSFLHSSAWQRFQQKVGTPCERQADQLYLRRSIPRSHYWISSRLAIGNKFSLPPFARNACFVRFEPLDEPSQLNLHIAAKQLGLQLVTTVAVQPRQTSVVDISRSYEEVLQSMKQKHRYNIRVAEKHGVKVDIISTKVSDNFDRFWNLLSNTAERQDFRTHDVQYYRSMTEELEKDGMIHFLFAKNDQQDLAVLLLINYAGTLTYLHGGSSNAQKQLMAPYLLHANAIQFGQQLGCTSYDLWGTDLQWNKDTQTWEPKAGSSAGTSRFKLGFSGQIIDYPGTFDLILKPFWYTLYKTLRSIRSGKRSFS